MDKCDQVRVFLQFSKHALNVLVLVNRLPIHAQVAEGKAKSKGARGQGEARRCARGAGLRRPATLRVTRPPGAPGRGPRAAPPAPVPIVVSVPVVVSVAISIVSVPSDRKSVAPAAVSVEVVAPPASPLAEVVSSSSIIAPAVARITGRSYHHESPSAVHTTHKPGHFPHLFFP